MTLAAYATGLASLRCLCGKQTLHPMPGSLYAFSTCMECGCTLRFQDGCFTVLYPMPDLRSHEPPRNSGEGTAVNGPMPLGEKDESRTAEPE